MDHRLLQQFLIFSLFFTDDVPECGERLDKVHTYKPSLCMGQSDLFFCSGSRRQVMTRQGARE